jgi:dihydroorotate dehydrogenase (NAD+) catalytic subunit
MPDRAAVGTVDLSVRVGSVTLPNPVLTASGTAGHGAELQPYVDLASLGGHVVKSLAAEPWAGNPAPRVHPAGEGMVNAVGLQGPGVQAWIDNDLPGLLTTRARIVVSIWGRSVDDYARAAALLADLPDQVIAVEVNLSCPNLEGRRGIFAHDPELSARVVDQCRVAARPLWAKLSANTDRVVEVAGAVAEAGAEAVTLVNTLLGMSLDPSTGRPVLGAGGGGYSGRPIHPVAVRAVFDVRAAHPDVPIVGVGGVHDGWSAAELIAAGAQAVQVGTANFAHPRAAAIVLDDLRRWCAEHGADPRSLCGAAHRGGW